MAKQAKKQRTKAPAPTTGSAPPRDVVLLAVALLVVLFAAYSPTFSNGFVYDDKDLVLQSPLVAGQLWGEIWTSDVWAQTTRLSSTYYRPLVVSSFAVEHMIHGDNPAGYHIDNLLLHCVAILLLFLVARDRFGRSREGALLSLAAAAIFAFHPANTQIVYWISARGDLFVAIGILLGMYCVMRTGAPATAGVIASAFLAFFSKETGVLYLVLVPLYAYIFGAQARMKVITTRLLQVAPVFLLYLALRFNAVPFGLGLSTEESFWTPADGPGARFMTVPAIWGYYLMRAVFPYFLNFETGIHLIRSPGDWQLWAGVFSLVAAVVAYMRLRKNTFVRWAGVFWVLSLLPFLNILVPTFESGMEHYLYLPLTAVAIMAASLLPKKRMVLPVMGVVVLSFAVTVFLRGSAWRDDVSLWSDAAAKTGVECRQGWTRAKGNLAHTYVELAEQQINTENNLREAESIYREIVETRPNFGHAWRGLGDVAFGRGQHEQAATYYRKAVEYRPHDYLVRNKLGVVLMAQKDYAGAKVQYQEVLAADPSYGAALLNLAVIQLIERDYRAGEATLAKMGASTMARYPNAQAVKTAIDVGNGRAPSGGIAAVSQAAAVLDQMELFQAQSDMLERIYAAGRLDADNLYRLALVNIVKLGQDAKGIAFLEAGLEKYPNDMRFMRAMAIAYERSGQNEKAAAMLERVLQAAPNHPDATAIRQHVKQLREKG